MFPKFPRFFAASPDGGEQFLLIKMQQNVVPVLCFVDTPSNFQWHKGGYGEEIFIYLGFKMTYTDFQSISKNINKKSLLFYEYIAF